MAALANPALPIGGHRLAARPAPSAASGLACPLPPLFPQTNVGAGQCLPVRHCGQGAVLAGGLANRGLIWQEQSVKDPSLDARFLVSLEGRLRSLCLLLAGFPKDRPHVLKELPFAEAT